MSMEPLGRMLLYIGIILALLGGFFMLMSKLPWFGRLPGDIVYHREGLTILIPITTMILVSIVLTILLNVVMRK